MTSHDTMHLSFLSIAIVLSAQTGLDVINTVYICPTRYCRAMEIFEAKYDYNKYGDGLLCLKRGDRLVVTDKSASGWWAARNLESDEFGYIPSAYVEVRYFSAFSECVTVVFRNCTAYVHVKIGIFEIISKHEVTISQLAGRYKIDGDGGL